MGEVITQNFYVPPMRPYAPYVVIVQIAAPYTAQPYILNWH